MKKIGKIKSIEIITICLFIFSSISSCTKANIESIDFEKKYSNKDNDSLLTEAKDFLSDLYNLKVTTGEKAEMEISLWEGDFDKTKKATLFGYDSTLYMAHNRKENAYVIDRVSLDLMDIGESEYKAISKAFASALVEISNGDITVSPYIEKDNRYEYEYMSARELKELLTDGWESWKNNWEDVGSIYIHWYDNGKSLISLYINFKTVNNIDGTLSNSNVSNNMSIYIIIGEYNDTKHEYVSKY